jgi:hypothetical protein
MGRHRRRQIAVRCLWYDHVHYEGIHLGPIGPSDLFLLRAARVSWPELEAVVKGEAPPEAHSTGRIWDRP